MAHFLKIAIIAVAAMLMVVVPSPAGADVVIKVSKVSQRMEVSVNGARRYTWTVSTGRPGFDTPVGVFRPGSMERMHISRKFGGEKMPHSIFFAHVAIHGTDDVARLGRPVSHSCVRLSPANAATLYGLVGRAGLTATTIEIR